MTIDIKIIKSDIDMNKRPEKVIDSVTQSDRVLQKNNNPKKKSVHHCKHNTARALGALGEPRGTGPQNMRRLTHLWQIVTLICALALLLAL